MSKNLFKKLRVFLAYFQYAYVRALSDVWCIATTSHGVGRSCSFMTRSIVYDPRTPTTEGFFLGPVLAPRGGPKSFFPCISWGVKSGRGQKEACSKRSGVKSGHGQKGAESVALVSRVGQSQSRWSVTLVSRVGQSRIFLVYKQRTTLIQQSVVYQTL
jgi:hypothetical protein